jgi:hypothetical protein
MSERRRRRILEDEEEENDDEDSQSSEEDDESEEGGEVDAIQKQLEQNSLKNNLDEEIIEISCEHITSPPAPTEHQNGESPSVGENETIKKKSARNSSRSREKDKATDPFAVPRGTRFFLHDDRKSQGKTPQPKQRSGKSDDLFDWKHDKFDELNEDKGEGEGEAEEVMVSRPSRTKRGQRDENSVSEETAAVGTSSNRTERGGRRGRGRVVTSVRGRGRGRIHQGADFEESPQSPPPPSYPTTEIPSGESMSFPPPIRDRRGGRTRRGRGRGPPAYDPNSPPTDTAVPDSANSRGAPRREGGSHSQFEQESEPQWQWNSEPRGDYDENSAYRHPETRERRGGRTSRGGRGRGARGGDRTNRYSQEFSSPSSSSGLHAPEYQHAPSSHAEAQDLLPPSSVESQAAQVPSFVVPTDISSVNFPHLPSSSPSSVPKLQTKPSTNQLKATAHEFHPHGAFAVAEMRDSPSSSHDEYHHVPYSAMDRGASLSPEYHHPIPHQQLYPPPHLLPHGTPPPDSVPPPLFWNPNQQAYLPHPGYYYPPQLPYHHPPPYHHHSLSPDQYSHPSSSSPYLYETDQQQQQGPEVMESSQSQYYQSASPYYPTHH